MGLFNSLKKNFKHGGVKLELQAPDTVSISDGILPVTITVSATESAVQINSVKAEITATSFDKSFSQPMGQTNMANSMGPAITQTVAQAVNPQSFTLQPGQSQSVQLQIQMNSNGQQNNKLSEVMGAAEQLFNPNRYSYSLVASVDVEGITLDPSKSQNLHIKGAGSMGIGAINL